MTPDAVTGHSTIDAPYDCFTFETGYSAVGGSEPAVNDRLRLGLTGIPDPLLSLRVSDTGRS